jgi:hypothetical protein
MHEHHADRPHPEQVVLEIGADLGALVVYTSENLHGVEIEISPTGLDERREHKEVLNRPVAGRPVHAAVFDRLTAGGYTLWIGGEAVARGVQVAGGRVAELDWRGAAVAAPALVGQGR